jgi:modification methylase
MTNHKIINGDARVMTEIKDESVHLITTSPPYWQLKDYGIDDQIGFNDSYEDYINHLNLVWQECYRVLHKGCRLCVNIGEQFARTAYYGRYKVISIHTEIIKFCEIIGFDYMGAIIWQKNTTMNTSGGGTMMGSFPNPRNGIVKLDYEFILLFKKQGDAPKPTPFAKDNSSMTKEEWNLFFNGHWHFGGARQDGHIAMYPEELPRRLIKMFSFVGDTVLDPFLGSGTTSLAAQNLDRDSVGYEINPEFIPMIKQKLKVDEPTIFGKNQYEFIVPTDKISDYTEGIEKLPYKCIDTHKLDKKVDVKKLQFGSKIDKEAIEQREEYFTVKRVLSAEKVELNTGQIIRLLGIKEDITKNGDAADFIYKKTKGQKVFLKFDGQQKDSDNNLFVYLYLQNKTFVNAHLIKNGLVLVDNEKDFKYKSKFNTYYNGKGMDIE